MTTTEKQVFADSEVSLHVQVRLGHFVDRLSFRPAFMAVILEK